MSAATGTSCWRTTWSTASICTAWTRACGSACGAEDLPWSQRSGRISNRNKNNFDFSFFSLEKAEIDKKREKRERVGSVLRRGIFFHVHRYNENKTKKNFTGTFLVFDHGRVTQLSSNKFSTVKFDTDL